uniref:Uncharacterized protein n=1 Tax=Trichogramma kaykai TaxID=54128 RepID=A0ABD2W713_9HYME
MPGSIWLQDVSRGDVPYVVANLVVVGKPREAMRKEEERKGAEMNRNKQQILLVKMAVFIAMTVTGFSQNQKNVQDDKSNQRSSGVSEDSLRMLQSRFGPTQMNKLFRILQLPNIDEKVLKSYERIVSSIVELIDEESILKAADLERTLTIENKSTLVKLLPDSHEKDFLVNDPEPLSNSQDSINDPIVKIFVFFDMGRS